jgi:hypothetical protein
MKTQLKIWAMAILSEFIEGFADGFLIVSGGAAVSQTGAITLPTATPAQLLYSSLLGGAWYAAAYIKKNPRPASDPTEPAPVSTSSTTT